LLLISAGLTPFLAGLERGWQIAGAVGLFVGVVWFIVAGHALFYGPHLFLYSLWELCRLPFRWMKKR
jgi:hypothetical protein